MAHCHSRSKGVFQFDVDFRPVKSPFPLVDLKGKPALLQGLAKRLRGPLPVLVRTDGARFRPGADLQVVGKSKYLHHIPDEIQDAFDLVVQLFGGAKKVGVVLGETAHAQKTVKFPRFFVAVDRPQFKIPERQIAVTADFGLVDEHVGQAVHRLQPVLLPFHFGEIHLVPVVVVMPGSFPQIQLQDLRADDDLVARVLSAPFSRSPPEASAGGRPWDGRSPTPPRLHR